MTTLLNPYAKLHKRYYYSRDSNNTLWGIVSEKQFVPNLHNNVTNHNPMVLEIGPGTGPLLPNPMVLEIGPGTGPLLPKIIEIYKKENVYAIQPLNAEYSHYNDTVRNLLSDNHFIEDSLENYSTKESSIKFDIVYIYKWNIPIKSVDDFINGLKIILNPGGIIYITSVEKERFHKHDPYMNLIDKIKPYFNIYTSVETVETYTKYGVVKLTHKNCLQSLA
uniref:Methyltransferase domain-containing protein n=1 Tax=viral metagenome TaxID=1070528 RepID=A0A6C0IWV6_9ZZZZ